MRIFRYRTLAQYYHKHPDAKTALEDWFSKTEESEWNNFSDMKATFNSVDAVENHRYVFNIKGNSYRLIAIVLFVPKHVYIRFIGTHAEYDKITDVQSLKKQQAMKAITNDREYQTITKRIDQLLDIVTDDNYNSIPEAVELDFLSTLIEEYDRKHYPIASPQLSEAIRLRMYEMNINQSELAKLLGVSPSRITEYLSGKEPSLKIARIICEKLNISANVVLGVSRPAYSKSGVY